MVDYVNYGHNFMMLRLFKTFGTQICTDKRRLVQAA